MGKNKDKTSVLIGWWLFQMDDKTQGFIVFLTLSCVCLKYKMFWKHYISFWDTQTLQMTNQIEQAKKELWDWGEKLLLLNYNLPTS